jgi:uncharacterized membrane protein YfbV (UPF0208 family)
MTQALRKFSPIGSTPAYKRVAEAIERAGRDLDQPIDRIYLQNS